MKRNRVSSVAVWPLAVLLAAVSLGGLLLPSAYARETPAWIAQAKGQDWFDVLVIVPWLVACGVMLRERPTYHRRAAWLGGGFLVAVGGLFALLWLADIVPALLHGTPSRDLADTGLYTNPVHVIDLSFVLPVHVIVGIALWHRHRIGEIYGPVVLAFGVAMAASIAGMQIAIAAMGGALALPVTITLLVVAGASGAILARMLFPPHVPAVTAIHAV